MTYVWILIAFVIGFSVGAYGARAAVRRERERHLQWVRKMSAHMKEMNDYIDQLTLVDGRTVGQAIQDSEQGDRTVH